MEIIRNRVIVPFCRWSSVSLRQFTCASGPLLFRATPSLSGEPLKKKKKLDMSIIITREQRKMRKIEKMIRKQEAKGRQLKPIDEIEGDRSFLKTRDKRKREPAVLSFDESERRALLHKDWARYKRRQHNHEMVALARVCWSQQLALEELRNESEELYQSAIQVDDQLIPYICRGPLETPPIARYEAPDGDYQDTTKMFDK